MKNFFSKNRKVILSVCLIVGSSFLVGGLAQAGWATNILGGIMQFFIWLLGKLLTMLMGVLIDIASYDNFIRSEAVSKGWMIVRDISNMFFVAVMLVIAFSTVIGVEKYNYQKALPKLIIMAVLINFSKTICGLLIDVSQVVMLTFVNAFKEMAGYNLTNMLGISEWQNLTEGDNSSIELTIAGIYFLALIYAIISVVVIAAMIMMLIMRIVMIWIYTALSPIAYLAASFPGGEKYSAQWWSEFTKNLLVGPVLAFFIWLSFSTVSTDAGRAVVTSSNIGITVSDNDNKVKEAATSELMIKFLISIGMLLGGLKITQSIGGAGGSIAGKAMGKLQKGAVFTGTTAMAFAKRKAVDPLAKGAANLGRSAKAGLGYVDREIGRVLVGKPKNKDGAGAQIRNAGLFSYLGGVASSGVGGRWAKNVKRGRREFSDLDDARRTYFEDKQINDAAAVMKYNGSKYKAGTDGKMYKLDKDDNITTEVLKVGEGNKQREVKEMGASAASFHSAKRKAFSKSRALSDAKEAEEVEAAKKKIAAKDLSFDEMAREMKNKSISETDRMAYASTLAEKGKLKDSADLNTAKGLLSGNSTLINAFKDNVNKKQAHLAYDLKLAADGSFANAGDKESFLKAIDKGDVDPTRMDADAYKNSGMLKALEEYYGRDFPRVMESVFKRGKKYEQSVNDGLLTRRQTDPSTGHIARDDQATELHARLTGDIKKSFNIDIKSSNGSFEVDALKKFFAGSAKNFENIDPKKLEEVMNKNQDAQKAIIENIEFSSLKSLSRKDGNRDVVRLMRDQILSEAKSRDAALRAANPKTTKTVTPPRGKPKTVTESDEEYEKRLNSLRSDLEKTALKIMADRDLQK